MNKYELITKEDEFDLEPRFKPQYFGGYTIAIGLSGFGSALSFIKWYLGLLGIIFFIVALYFYAKNKEEYLKNGKN